MWVHKFHTLVYCLVFVTFTFKWTIHLPTIRMDCSSRKDPSLDDRNKCPSTPVAYTFKEAFVRWRLFLCRQRPRLHLPYGLYIWYFLLPNLLSSISLLPVAILGVQTVVALYKPSSMWVLGYSFHRELWLWKPRAVTKRHLEVDLCATVTASASPDVTVATTFTVSETKLSLATLPTLTFEIT